MDDRKMKDALDIVTEYIDEYIVHGKSGCSWWEAHTGAQYSGNVGYFLEMWRDILDAFGIYWDIY